MSPSAAVEGPLQVQIKKCLGRFQLDVAFEAGEGATVLFGPSGSGKSSVLAAVAGTLRPDAGLIQLGGETLFEHRGDRPRIDQPPEARGIGWVFQDARLFPHMTVEANLRYGLKRARSRPQRIGFAEAIDMLGIGALLQRRPSTLSGGEAQRVGIGRAILSQPRLLMMDEPLAALDEARKGEILTFIEGVRNAFALPILYVTHSRTEAARLAARIVTLEEGRVVAAGTFSTRNGADGFAR